MRVHYLQHVPFEGIGAIGDWVWARGHDLSATRLFRASDAAASVDADVPVLPAPDALDLLVVMGGPMGVYQTNEYPWLDQEKAFIKEMIDHGRAVLGICLGAQLIADVLGGSVTRNAHREIGWWPVQMTAAGRGVLVFADFPHTFTSLHWHGDTFAIPPGAVHVATSDACTNQAFALDGGRVVGLQFHLEETASSLASLVKNAGHDLVVDPTQNWVQSEHDILRWNAPYDVCRGLLFALLDRMAPTGALADGSRLL